MESMLRRIALIFLALFAVSGAAASTWYIKPDGTGDAPTIEAGIDSSAAGDTVLVACGTYYESELYMKSGVVLRGETGLPDCVTIDGDERTVLWCVNVDAATRIEGLTLTNGVLGAHCYWCHGTFADCVFADNVGSEGGGMLVQECETTLLRCVFQGNTAGSVGGGLVCHGPPIACRRGARFLETVVTECVFSGNSATCGGAIATTYFGELIATDCVFIGNTASEKGGALSLDCPNVTISGCVFYENSAPSGGAIFSHYAAPLIANCTLVGNTAMNRGAGILVGIDSDCVMLENTIIADSPDGEAIWCFGSPPLPVLSCCDLYGNADGDWVGCVVGQETQSGNFSADPLFCDPENGNFTLAENSPCLPGNHPHGWDCGVIGALGQGCGPIALIPETWARVKAMYR